ncbi:hypothetical protein [Actinacidiphila guanduensis]|uniref:Lipoprotein n=1 Tax=Actinacidiphila guanduensis TaxID=310781 RepID=A0A1H0R1L2_9ACTN|nr:hypothetical protein [Actinacidiphila guanduensis]SDP23377.1 hypothetical protein SAMN05216259_12091 [Actinacidiphila guanduensis]
MSRTTLPTAAAVATTALTAALLLTACSSNSSTNSDKITTSPATPTAATTTSAPPASSAARRPVIALPHGAQNVFEDQQTGDPKKDAVLADNQQWVNSMDEAILKRSSDTSHIAFYSTGQGYESAVSFVDGYLGKKDTWIGTTRFFQRKVTFLKSGEASVVYCSDESKAFIKHSNGKVDNTPTTADSYVLYNTRLAKDKQGVWQTDYVVSQRGAKECQP